MPAHSVPNQILDLDSFSYIVAHDLRAPLRGLTLLTSKLQASMLDRMTEEERREADLIAARLQRMSDLVDDVGRFAQAASARNWTEDVRAVVQDSWGSRPGFQLRLQDPLSALPLPPLQLAAVLRALLENAVVHHPRGEGTVTVSGGGPKGAWLEIQDDGAGLPAPLAELCEPFRLRLDRAGNSITSVGLALCRHILSHHGGNLTHRPSEVGTVLRIEFETG